MRYRIDPEHVTTAEIPPETVAQLRAADPYGHEQRARELRAREAAEESARASGEGASHAS